MDNDVEGHGLGFAVVSFLPYIRRLQGLLYLRRLQGLPYIRCLQGLLYIRCLQGLLSPTAWETAR